MCGFDHLKIDIPHMHTHFNAINNDLIMIKICSWEKNLKNNSKHWKLKKYKTKKKINKKK